MSYKDKDRQREAVRDATRRYRLRKQGITKADESVIPVIPEQVIPWPAIPTKSLRQPLTKELQLSRKGFNK